MRQFSILRIIWIFSLLIIFCCIGNDTQAATLSFSSKNIAVESGKNFSLSLVVGSTDQAMNSASGVISFPTNKLEVISVSKSGSIFNLWVKEPSFSNAGGTVNFEGIILNPGYTGPSGKILSVTFRAKATGQATINLSSSSVLANDGKGTNILTGTGSATISIGEVGVIPPQPTPGGVPEAPVVTSASHPLRTNWYTNPNPEFSWKLPTGVDQIAYGISESQNTNPTIQAAGLPTTATYSNIADGQHYFHIRFHSAKGWGLTTHFQFNVDTTPPVPLTITFPHGTTSDDPRPTVLFNTTDDMSGIDYYEIKVGDENFIKVTKEEIESNPYAIPSQEPGSKIITVRAYDKAGNYVSNYLPFTVEGLESPSLIEAPKTVQEGDLIRVRGNTYPDADVTMFLTEDNGQTISETVHSNSLGYFSLIWSKALHTGNYTYTFQVMNADGAKSALTKPYSVRVQPKLLVRIGSLSISILTIVISILALILLVITLALYIWKRFAHLKRTVNKNIHQAEGLMHETFGELRDHLQTNLHLLEKAKKKRALTSEEAQIVRQMGKDLEAAEKCLARKMRHLEKDVE